MLTKKNLVFTALATIILLGLGIAQTVINNNGIEFQTVNSKINLTTDGSITVFSQGQPIELTGLSAESKPYIGWYTYDPFSDMTRGVGWLGCHYNLSNGNRHQHCSFETLNNVSGSPTLNTVFEMKYGSNLTQSDEDFYVGVTSVNRFRLGNGVDLTLEGGGGDIRHMDNILDLYPHGQTTLGLRISNDSNSATIASSGSTILKIDDNLQVGDGDSQFNITLTSPDGTEFSCGVNNSGSLLCS